jgi:tetratricopeptide (TPR) repeat protein
MTSFAFFALIGWIPLTFALFVCLPARRAVVVGAIAGWLLLPPMTISLPGFPDYSKTTAIALGILLSTVIFEFNRLINFRLRWFDLPMLIWGLCPFVSSISNDLGVYDAFSALVLQAARWTVPYLIGRVYFTDSAGLRELAFGIVIGGVCLIPLCLFELKMSPLLCRGLYGYQASLYMRYGAFRPHAFFSTGLELGLWMSAVTLTAWWLWLNGQLKRLWLFPGGLIFVALLVTSILCRSTGAILLLIAGASLLWFCRRTKTAWVLWCILLVPPIYYAARIPNLWTGENLVALVRTSLDADRAGSLSFRLDNENAFAAHALKRPAFGWGGWGRNLVKDQNERNLAIDSLWIITFGCHGFVGLASMTTALALPVLLFLVRFPAVQSTSPRLAHVTVIALILNLFLIDCLLNAMLNAIYLILAGGLVNIVPVRAPRAAKSVSSGTHREILAARYRTAGRAANDQGRFAEAKSAWFHALKLLTQRSTAEPGAQSQAIHMQWCECANDLAWLLANALDPRVRDVASALALAKKVTEAHPECKTYWNTLGAAYYRAGDFKAAVAALDRTKTSDDGGTVFDHVFLAMAHAQLGNQDESRRWLSLAMIKKERDNSGHSELTRFCTEAHSVIAESSDAPAVSLFQLKHDHGNDEAG